MKSVILVALAFAAVAVAAPAEPIKILKSSSDVNPDGAYVYNFETENGIVRSENGDVKQVLDAENKPHEVVVMRGSFSYVDPEGKTQLINYYADEFGFHAEGDSIPKVVVARR
ncbi:larval cuticle protein 16/17-like [Manduca sexta]|uniref:Uncharacterized protein n=1 Tax=Manduca sexta TaxID=7130 RepID=A0A921Z6G0_MANSE|nr:larval cuticle protein 16/17-like [Manduca sexta]KAG6451784.1 hypothetical protein O3G_MSEX007373 [Manduca sexta]KAG6451785.1 hypothetical protein O3G_MSEX007373 [Manduca sexta]